MWRAISFLYFLLFSFINANAQTLTADSLAKMTPSFISAIEKKLQYLEQSLEKNTMKTLAALEKSECRLRVKLYKKDSTAAAAIFAGLSPDYSSLKDNIKNPVEQQLKEYIPSFDSLQTSLRYLSDPVAGIHAKLPAELKQKLKAANTRASAVQSKMQQAEEIKKFIRERKLQLQTQLSRYGFGKDLKKINKEVYYYQQQLNEYKAILKDPKKAEKKTLALLSKTAAFQDFMKKHSQLALLFRVPENYGTPQSLAGLQTRASVQAQLDQRFASFGANPQQYISEQVRQAQGELAQLKDKINKLGGGNSDIEIPDFKPNTQKTKRFLNRIEYGANIQSQKARGLLPVTSDIALTAGYRLNDKSVIGIGSAYKIGWGSNWQHIKFSSQGIGLRSYFDYKIKGSFWLSGGYEQNYLHAFNSIPELRIFEAWQSSGLIGITQKIKIGKKTNNMQVLWDFLSYGQKPRRQALVWRVGISF